MPGSLVRVPVSYPMRWYVGSGLYRDVNELGDCHESVVWGEHNFYLVLNVENTGLE